MKKMILFLFVSVILISGCSISVKTVYWPEQNMNFSWYKPAFIYSADEAMSVLKGLTAGASINGRNISTVDIDKFTIRVSQKWQEVQQNSEYVPSYGGFFIGWDYVPVFGGSYQKTSTTLNKEDNVAVNFRDISDISINGRVLYISSASMAVLVCNSQAEAQKFGDAFYSMMKINGLRLPASYGFTFGAMTQDQEKEIKKTGPVIAVVYSGGPADRAGLRPTDIVYETNGIKVKTPEDIVNAIKKTSGEFKALELKVVSWQRTGPDSYTVKWEKRGITIKPVER